MTKKQMGLCTFFFVLVAFFVTNHGFAEEVETATASIYVDNKPIKTDYTVINSHLLVPALFFKHTGVRVDKSEKYESIIFRKEGKQIAVPIGKDYADEYMSKEREWKRTALATKARKVEDQVFVPFLDVAKKLNMDIGYDEDTSSTYVTTHTAPRDEAHVIRQGNTDKKYVALTFDDGPDNINTPAILDILNEKDVKATFFVMGEHVEQYPNVMKRIVKDGHGIGNHTMNHPSLPETMSSDVLSEVLMTQHMLEKTTGHSSDLFRPPYGALTKADVNMLHELGLRVVHWSVDTEDWKGRSAEEILSTVEKNISPGGIILQHDFPATETRKLKGSIEALPKIIDNLRAKGYQFVTVQTMLDNERQTKD